MQKRPHPIVQLARAAIQEYLSSGKILEPPEALPPEMYEPAGVFVSLKKGGSLRGCIGTFEPTTPHIVQEVIRNAIHAATKDPRFPPVTPDEMDLIDCSVDVLSPLEPVSSLKSLDPGRYGVLIQRGFQRGLLLPDIEGVHTVEEQIEIARRKAGIGPDWQHDHEVQIFRFEVKRYH